MQPRAVILIDESNITNQFRDYNKRIEWNTLIDYLKKQIGTQFGIVDVDVLFFVGIPPFREPFTQRAQGKIKFIDWVRESGYICRVREGLLTNYDDRTQDYSNASFKANVDVLMCTEAIELAYTWNPQLFVIATGDNDFAHVTNKLRNKGHNVAITSLQSSIGVHLRQSVSIRYYLDELLTNFPPYNRFIDVDADNYVRQST